MYIWNIKIDDEVYIKNFEEEIEAYNFALTKFGYIISDNKVDNGVLKVIDIEPLSDEWDCETCGWDHADGAKVKLDGVEILHLEPIAHCFNGVSYSTDEIYNEIISHLNLPIIIECDWEEEL